MRPSVPTVALVAVAAGLPSAASAAVIRVPEDQPSLAAAVAVAAPCDVIRLGDGVWYESVTLPQGVELEGEGVGLTWLGGTTDVVVRLDTGSELRDLTLLPGTATVGVRKTVGAAWMRRVHVDSLPVAVDLPNSALVAIDVEVRDASDTAFRVSGDADLQIESSVVTGGGVGISVSDSWLKVRDSVIEGAEVGMSTHNTEVSFEATDFVGNELAASLFDSEGTFAGTVFDGNDTGLAMSQSDLSVLDCTFTGNGLGLTVDTGAPLVLGSLFHGNLDVGLLAGPLAEPLIASSRFVEHPVMGMLLLYSDPDILQTDFLGNAVGIEARSAGAQIRGDLFVGNGVGLRVIGTPVSRDYDLYWDNDTDIEGGGFGAHDVVGDPVLSGWSEDGDPANDDYALGAGSAAVDAGPEGDAFADLDGSRADIGATGGPDADVAYVATGNEAPQLSVFEQAPVGEGNTYYIYYERAGDPNGDFYWTRLDYDPTDDRPYCDGLNGETTTFADEGTYPVGIRAVDALGASRDYEVLVEVTNQVPQVTVDGIGAVDEGDPWFMELWIFDPGPMDAPVAAIDWEGDGIDDEVDLLPGYYWHEYGDDGVQPVRVTARDVDGGENGVEVDVTVHNVAPTVLSSAPRGPVDAGDTYEYGVVAYDPGWLDHLSYSLDAAPDGMAVDALGRITWTPGGDQVGSHAVVVSVMDDDGGVDSQSFDVVVEASGSSDDDGADDDGAGDDDVSGDDDAADDDPVDGCGGCALSRPREATSTAGWGPPLLALAAVAMRRRAGAGRAASGLGSHPPRRCRASRAAASPRIPPCP